MSPGRGRLSDLGYSDILAFRRGALVSLATCGVFGGLFGRLPRLFLFMSVGGHRGCCRGRRMLDRLHFRTACGFAFVCHMRRGDLNRFACWLPRLFVLMAVVGHHLR